MPEEADNVEFVEDGEDPRNNLDLWTRGKIIYKKINKNNILFSLSAYNFVYNYGSLKVDDVMGFLMEEAGLEGEGKEERHEKNIVKTEEGKEDTNHDKKDPELEVPKTTERSILITSTMPQSDSSDPD